MHGDPDTRRQLDRLAASVFPPATALAFEPIFPDDGRPDECPPGAIAARRHEFAAGRRAARRALGFDVPLPMGADRAPVWPPGITGSITHAGGWALAVTAPAPALIGADLELDEDLPDEVFDTVLLPEETTWVQRMRDPARWARVIFSAKECAYKAQYPVTRTVFGFEGMTIALGPEAGVFAAQFTQPVGPFGAGFRLNGRFARSAGFILTGMT